MPKIQQNTARRITCGHLDNPKNNGFFIDSVVGMLDRFQDKNDEVVCPLCMSLVASLGAGKIAARSTLSDKEKYDLLTMMVEYIFIGFSSESITKYQVSELKVNRKTLDD